jgi:hypothetical protein
MIKAFKRLWNDRRGNALVIAGAALPLVVGSAGLATDTIQWTLWKRQLQRAADSAAMAGVYAKASGQAVEGAVNGDLTYNQNTGIALVSGYPEITFPANTADWDNAVKVSLAVKRSLAFSSMFVPAPTIVAAATAAIADSGKYCVVSLENTSTTGIVDSGNATVDLGCGMITNSTSLNAAIATGSASVNASPVAAVGGIQDARQWGSSKLLPFTVAQADPYSGVNVDGSNVSSCANDPKVNPGDDVELAPGCYKGLTLNGKVKLKPGIYYIDGGTSASVPNGLDVGAQGNVDGTGGVTIVLTNSSSSTTAPIGNVKINGSAQVKLTAPSTGCVLGTSGCYDGLVLYQDRRASDDGNSSNSPNLINGNSNSVFNGAFYFPNQQVGFNGNGGLKTDCFQLVARRVDFKGNMTVRNTCSSGGPPEITGRHVRLVA